MAQPGEPSRIGLLAASQIVEAAEHEWPAIFENLRRNHQLSTAIREMNALLSDPKHRVVASAALRRMGLEHAW